jgi:hypothetical protein
VGDSRRNHNESGVILIVWITSLVRNRSFFAVIVEIVEDLPNLNIMRITHYWHENCQYGHKDFVITFFHSPRVLLFRRDKLMLQSYSFFVTNPNVFRIFNNIPLYALAYLEKRDYPVEIFANICLLWTSFPISFSCLLSLFLFLQ